MTRKGPHPYHNPHCGRAKGGRLHPGETVLHTGQACQQPTYAPECVAPHYVDSQPAGAPAAVRSRRAAPRGPTACKTALPHHLPPRPVANTGATANCCCAKGEGWTEDGWGGVGLTRLGTPP
eukprot:79989-Chlamydomonas_euryale.AAC.4